jgi:threonine/homoserine/homoserine lactone efflux protein
MRKNKYYPTLMPISELLISFIVTCTVMELTPGPNMTYLALLSAMKGRKAGFAAIIGIGAGLLLSGIIAAVGLAAIIAESPDIYQILRWAGVAYLLWLAYDCWRGREAFGTTDSIFEPRLVARGFIINLLNPKAALFYITVLPNFTRPQENILSQTLLLTVISVAIATLVHIVIVLLGSRIKHCLGNPRIAVAIRYVFTVLLIGIAVWFARSTH